MKTFHLTKNYALINFDANNCTTSTEVLNSRSFNVLLKSFIRHLKETDSLLLHKLKDVSGSDILSFYKLLLVYSLDDALKIVSNIKKDNINDLYTFSEEFYNFYRKLIRFGFLKSSKNYDPNLKVNDLLNKGADFNNLIITLYRTITEKLLNSNFHVYRSLPAGVNASMLYVRHKFSNDKTYLSLNNIPFITKVSINPPFMINSKSNIRSGLFKEIKTNPLTKIAVNSSSFVAFPVYVGPLLAFVYIHRDFLHQGIALSNLFEFANYSDFKNIKPNLVVVYGINEKEYDLTYHYDKLNDLYLGFISNENKNDYFGYLKKILLTLHNVYMIDNNNLPIHGAMVKLVLNNKEQKTICIMGDSGAGKSETLEALRKVGGKYIKKMDVIFDDMGSFKIINNKVYANGTETGAFVRLDDLDSSYVYEVMDRALFLNPTKVNKRVVIPITNYDFILKNHQIDLLLYANNYDNNKGVKILNNLDEALRVFKRGRRLPVNTTSEKGLTDTFFANPFGPVQLKDKTNLLIDNYFKTLKENKTIIGKIYTNLAITSSNDDLNETAKELLKYLINYN